MMLTLERLTPAHFPAVVALLQRAGFPYAPTSTDELHPYYDPKHPHIGVFYGEQLIAWLGICFEKGRVMTHIAAEPSWRGRWANPRILQAMAYELFVVRGYPMVYGTSNTPAGAKLALSIGYIFDYTDPECNLLLYTPAAAKRYLKTKGLE